MATPAFFKRILQGPNIQWAASRAISAYLSLVKLTSQIEQTRAPVEGPHILALWHGRLLLLPMLRPGPKPLVMLLSLHRDGRTLSKALAMFNILTASGSSSRGGAQGVREMIRFARDGHSLSITPDGPRGPRMQLNGSIIDLARMTGLPILPATMSARRGVNLNSWDRFLLPGLFTTVVIRWGEPIIVTSDGDPAEIGARLNSSMTAIQNEADALVGRTVIEPA